MLRALAIVAAAALACSSAAGSAPRSARPDHATHGPSCRSGAVLTASAARNSPRVRLHPSVVARGRHSTITVSALEAPSLEALVVGATVRPGRAVSWTRLHRSPGGDWRGVLPASELRGVYRLELRIRRGSPVMRSDDWLVRVFARGTVCRPSFATPEAVARWWVGTLPSNAVLVATKRWPLAAGDHRDPRFHRKLVIAYSRAGHRAIDDRLGMFVTAVRDPSDGRWRLLEATVAP